MFQNQVCIDSKLLVGKTVTSKGIQSQQFGSTTLYVHNLVVMSLIINFRVLTVYLVTFNKTKPLIFNN